MRAPQSLEYKSKVDANESRFGLRILLFISGVVPFILIFSPSTILSSELFRGAVWLQHYPYAELDTWTRLAGGALLALYLVVFYRMLRPRR